MAGSILGTAVRRVEDPELLTGRATYVGNLALPGALHLHFVRSPMAHAELAGIDTTAAAAAPGVVAVFTAADLDLPAHHGLFAVNPRAAAAAAGDRPGAVRRRGRRRRRRRERGRRRRRRRPRGGRLHAAARRRRPRGGRRARPRRCSSPTSARTSPPACAPPTGPTRSTARTSSSGRAWSTNGSRWCRWRATPSRCCPASHERAPTPPRSSAHDLGLHPDAARLPQPGRPAVRPRPTSRCGSSPRTSAARSAARPACRPSTPSRSGVARALGRPVRWVDTRSENLVSMPHGRGQVAMVRAGPARATAASPACGPACSATPARTPASAVPLALGPHVMMAQGVYDIPKIAYDARRC